MSRLEENLIDLGYMQDWQNQYIYWKQFNVCDIIAGLTQVKKECWLRLTHIKDLANKKEAENPLPQASFLCCLRTRSRPLCSSTASTIFAQ